MLYKYRRRFLIIMQKKLSRLSTPKFGFPSTEMALDKMLTTNFVQWNVEIDNQYNMSPTTTYVISTCKSCVPFTFHAFAQTFNARLLCRWRIEIVISRLKTIYVSPVSVPFTSLIRIKSLRKSCSNELCRLPCRPGPCTQGANARKVTTFSIRATKRCV